MRPVALAEIIEESGVRFGTSGARGLADAITDRVAYAYTRAFLDHLAASGQAGSGREVAIAGDLRPSTGRIMDAVARAVLDAGREAVSCGRVPTPALAVFSIGHDIPGIMVTGSHIPDDRNGIKYYGPKGEILKQDEAGILGRSVPVPAAFDDRGALVPTARPNLVENAGAREAYVARWTRAFPGDWLIGLTIGLYEHSAAGRDLTAEILAALGARVARFGRSDRFVPVDTEAIRPEDVAIAAQAAKEHDLFAVVSTDGDGDRPLVGDERGRWLRGDVLGILVARFFGADVVVTPVSSNTAVEACGSFREVRRTRIGSPYVIAEMMRAASAGARAVIGYEANGGVLTATTLEGPSGRLPPLATRDAVIAHLAVIGDARRRGTSVSALALELPARFTFSDRLKSFPAELAAMRIGELRDGGFPAFRRTFAGLAPPVAMDDTDGLRCTLGNGDIVHLRASGNAPELRCYAESVTAERAAALAHAVLEVAQRWR